MQTCNEHDNCIVVYDSPNCPVCEQNTSYRQHLNEKDEEIQSLEQKLDEQ